MSNFRVFNRPILPLILMGVLEKNVDNNSGNTQTINLSSQTAGKGNIMIPQISQAPGVVQLVLNFCKSWSNKVLPAIRRQVMPIADNVDRQQYLPTSPRCGGISRSTADVALIARLAAQERYSS